jgi:hypothetical protein
MFGRFDPWTAGTAAALAPLVARAARRDPGAGAAIRAAVRIARPYDWTLAALTVAAQPPRRRPDNDEETKNE